MALIGSASSSAVALSDTVEIARNQGFMVSQDCTLVHRLRGDSSDSTWNFLAGQIYDLDIKLAKSTGSTAATTLYVVFASIHGSS
jgi:hypothetical protein